MWPQFLDLKMINFLKTTNVKFYIYILLLFIFCAQCVKKFDKYINKIRFFVLNIQFKK